MGSGPEHKFQDAFVDRLRVFGAKVTPLTGSIYVAGQPDLLVDTTEGVTYYIENKVWDLKRDPRCIEDIHDLLHGPQIGVIKGLWRRNSCCVVAAVDMRNKRFAYVATGAEWNYINWWVDSFYLARSPTREFILQNLFLTVR